MKLVKKYYKHILIGIFCGFFNGLFGAGGGSLAVPAMEKFLDIDSKKSHSTAILIILILSCVSSFLYVKSGYIDIKLLIPVTIGGIIGGAVGAKLLARISVRSLKIIFGAVILVTAIKMIF